MSKRKKYKSIKKESPAGGGDEIQQEPVQSKNEALSRPEDSSESFDITAFLSEKLKSKYWRNALYLAVIFIAGLLIYSNIFDNEPQFDDILWTEFPEFRNLDEPMEIIRFGRLRALTLLTFAVNYHFSQMNLASYFIFNLAVHFVNTLLVWLIVRLLLRTPVMKDSFTASHADLAAFLAALVFVTHPIMTQAVTYIYQRLASFTTMFYLLTVFNFLKGKLSEKNSTKIIFYILSFLSFALGAVSKEIIFTVPVMLLIINTIFFQKKIRVKIIYAAAALIFLAGAAYAGVKVLGAEQLFGIKQSYFGEQISNLNYFINQFRVVLKYLQLFIFPYNQNFDYDWKLIESFWHIGVILPLVVHLAVFTGTYFLFKKNRLAAFGIIWIYVALSVESTIIPIEDIIFEHRMYLPMAGFCIFLTASVFHFVKKEKLKTAAIIICAWALINAGFTYYRNMIWDNPVSLWTDVIEKSPEKTRSYIFLAHAYIDRGELDSAVSVYSRAIAVNPSHSNAYMGRAVAYFSGGDFKNALKDYNKAIKIDPDDMNLYEDRAKTHAALKDYKKALADFRKAVSFEEGKKKAVLYYYIGEALMYLGRYKEAEAETLKALKLKHNKRNCLKQLINVGIKSDNFKKAIKYSDMLIEDNPENSEAYIIRADCHKNLGMNSKALNDYISAYNLDTQSIKALKNMAVIYYDRKQFLKAAAAFERIVQINHGDYESYYDMGSSYYLSGNNQKALEAFRKALEINPNFEMALRGINIVQSNMKQ